ncbi:VG15 protein [Streptomyces sp. A1-5]|uniref:VG15 protein n=1 Tax=Streptomyces sp. A1-5 TaxID=2738410 RepID=UPI001F246407|nr:hypothetical protein [Streptomyces sp. A1-5]UJB43597.1 hypothetical protein HRD51_24875 [Streptomyces sp. A1-5]
MSELGERLTAAHQRAQRALTGDALKKLSTAWAAVDPADESSWLRYVAQAEELCQAARTKSGQAAVSYFDRFRRAERRALGLVADGFTVSPPGLAPPGELERVLSDYGPGYVRRLVAKGLPVEEAKRLALSGQLGNVTGHILRPGRNVIADGIDRDRRCIGWRRVCSGAACSFCAMLASRGAVYKSEASARGSRGASLSTHGKGTAKGGEVHRACQCHMEPVYARTSRPTPQERRYGALWREAGGDPIQFRRLIEGRA